MEYYPVIQIEADSADSLEQLGTKEKFWFNNRKYLFKIGRLGTGEHWAEKVACELCSLLKIPHAVYNFGIYNGVIGVISEKFVPDGGRLIHGNELLSMFVSGYEEAKFYKQSDHTISRVLTVIGGRGINPPFGFIQTDRVNSSLGIFIGYLMLDALISNQDRHHENWGLILTKDKKLHLAPSYDHASSLGRNESDEKRTVKLATMDERQSVEYYVNRAVTPFYYSKADRRPLSTVEAFYKASEYDKESANCFLDRLKNIQIGEVRKIFEKIHPDIISSVAIDFALKMIDINKKRLLGLRSLL